MCTRIKFINVRYFKRPIMCHTECQLLTTFFLHFIYSEKIKNDEKIYWKLFAIFKRSHRYFMIFLASQYHATSVKFFNFPKFRHWKSTKGNNTSDEKRDRNTRKTTTKSPQTCAKWIECYFIQISNGSVKRRRDLRTMIYCQKEFMFVLQQSIEKFRNTNAFVEKLAYKTYFNTFLSGKTSSQ